MFDKRTCRRDHRAPFAAAVRRWRLAHGCAPPHPPPPDASPGDDVSKAAAEASLSGGIGDGDDVAETAAPRGTAAFVRKRPFFAAEAARGEFDCVSVPGPSSVAVHVCLMKPDLRHMFARHVTFGGAAAFGEHASDAAVFAAAAAPLLRCALRGAPAALFMFGQTGSGKTHTMAALEAMSAAALLPGGAEVPASAALRVWYVELAGKRCSCLLGGGEVSLRDGEGTAVDLVGATCATLRSAQQLRELLASGRARRAVSATAANATSSRSHALLRLALPGARGGSVTLVDCAGSERKEDSARHDAAQRREGAEINASLFALKECVPALCISQHACVLRADACANTLLRCMRARNKAAAATAASAVAWQPHVHVPYRSSSLTRLLAEALTHRGARLAVVGTLSPASADAEHSLATLAAVAELASSSSAAASFSEAREDVPAGLAVNEKDGSVRDAAPLRLVPPVQWRPAELRDWLQAVQGGAFAAAAQAAPDFLAGRDVARMGAPALASMLCGGDAAKGAALHAAFRDAVARAAAAKAAK
jgi:kinesin family protein 2/24